MGTQFPAGFGDNVPTSLFDAIKLSSIELNAFPKTEFETHFGMSENETQFGSSYSGVQLS